FSSLVALGHRLAVELRRPAVQRVWPHAEVVGHLVHAAAPAVAHHANRVALELVAMFLSLLRHVPDSRSLLAPSGVRETGSASAISYSAPKELCPGIGNQLQVVTALGHTPADGYESARRQYVLDLVKDDLR